MRNALAACFVVLLSCPAFASAAQAPCTDAKAECTEMMMQPGVRGGTMVYRSYSLSRPEPAVTHALIIIHGLGRDADSYYASALAATFTAHALADTIVVAPHFSSNEGSCKDSLAMGEFGWHCQPRNDTWRTGGKSVEEDVTSFDVIDELLRRLNDRANFPNLKTIVVSGHSAGGQFVERYAMANTVHDTLAVKPTYVVMNPSSYAYLDELRPTDRTPPTFARYHDAQNCTGFDRWPYGLQDRNGYAAKIPDEQLKKQAVERPTTYLAGEYDILPLHGFDKSCAAMAQGATRLARAHAFTAYIDERFGAKHEVHEIGGCGHSGRCMLVSGQAAKFLFP